MNKESLKLAVQEFANKSDIIWYKHLKYVNITKHSKAWWNEDCQVKLAKYRILDNWKMFKSTVKKTKYLFFDDKIKEIASKNRRPWELINWVKKQKLLAIEAL